MILVNLFIEFLQIGAFSFGGGFATLPFIYQLAQKSSWISLEEINQMVTISQMTPGPLACNIATYVGVKLYGIMRSTNCYYFICNTGNYFHDNCV